MCFQPVSNYLEGQPSCKQLFVGRKVASVARLCEENPLLPPYPGPSSWVQRFTFVKKEKRCYNKQASRVPVKIYDFQHSSRKFDLESFFKSLWQMRCGTNDFKNSQFCSLHILTFLKINHHYYPLFWSRRWC